MQQKTDTYQKASPHYGHAKASYDWETQSTIWIPAALAKMRILQPLT